MIRTVADLLGELLDRERRKLAELDIQHAPTIGAMYEGLTASILRRAIPVELGLRVVDGFVIDGAGNRSEQIDCMVVQGKGMPIPYTTSWEWHVSNVLAVIEVKKTLRGAELADAFNHLRTVKDCVRSYLANIQPSDEPVDIRAALRCFAQVTHTVPPDHDHVRDLPFEDQILYHTLVAEQVGPAKIVFGYDGFRTELGFRRSLHRFLTANAHKRGYGPGSFPELIVSGQYSLAKANGLPYSAPRRDSYWDFYFSSPTDPVVLLLEFIWTQVDRHYGVEGLWGEDLRAETAHPFLAARAAKGGSQVKWDLLYRDLGARVLTADRRTQAWEPEYLTLEEAVVFNMLCRGITVRFDDVNLTKFCAEQEVTIDNLKSRLLSTNLIAARGEQLELISDECVCVVLPGGQFIAAENSTGRLTNWLRAKDIALRRVVPSADQNPLSHTSVPVRVLMHELTNSAQLSPLEDGLDAVVLPFLRADAPHAVVVIEATGFWVPVGPEYVVDQLLSSLLKEGFVVSDVEYEDLPRPPGWGATLSADQLEISSSSGAWLYRGSIDIAPQWLEAIDRTPELVVLAGSLLGTLGSDPLASVTAARATGRVVGGIVPVSSPVGVVPRNARCPCGSGMKYKHCHGRRDRTSAIP